MNQITIRVTDRTEDHDRIYEVEVATDVENLQELQDVIHSMMVETIAAANVDPQRQRDDLHRRLGGLN